MTSKEKPISLSGMIILFLVLVNILVIKAGYTVIGKWYWTLIVTLPLLLLAILKVKASGFPDATKYRFKVF